MPHPKASAAISRNLHTYPGNQPHTPAVYDVVSGRLQNIGPNTDMTSPSTCDRYLSKLKTAENAASDGFGSNFRGAAFCLAQPIGGLLVVVLRRHAYIVTCPVIPRCSL